MKTTADTKSIFDNTLCLLAMSAETPESYVFAVVSGASEEIETVIAELVDAGLVESTVDAATFAPALRLSADGKIMAEACKARFALMRRFLA